MEKYRFTFEKLEYTDSGIIATKETRIQYKCLICGETREYDNTWSAAKKAEVQAEVNAHYNEHFSLIT